MSNIQLQKNLTERGMVHVYSDGSAVCNSQISSSPLRTSYTSDKDELNEGYLIRDGEVVGPICKNCARIINGEMDKRINGVTND